MCGSVELGSWRRSGPVLRSEGSASSDRCGGGWGSAKDFQTTSVNVVRLLSEPPSGPPRDFSDDLFCSVVVGIGGLSYRGQGAATCLVIVF
eukprot:2980696-Rhodomonas_salina.4